MAERNEIRRGDKVRIGGGQRTGVVLDVEADGTLEVKADNGQVFPSTVQQVVKLDGSED